MLYAIVAVLVVIVDQLVKYSIAASIAEGAAGVPLIPGVLSLVNLHNDGAAFGLFSGGSATIPFIVLAIVFLVLVIVALATGFISNRMGRWSLVLMAAGGIANCIDRVVFGFVQDMFKLEQFKLFGFTVNFPVFNVADVFITVFCILFVLAILFGRSDEAGEDEFAEDDEEEDRPRPEKREKREKEPKPPKNTRKSRQAKYEDEYEQYKAAKAARQQAAQAQAQAQPQPQTPVRRAPAPSSSDPFAEWERANAAAGNASQQPVAAKKPAAPAPAAKPATPAPQPAAVPKPSAPATKKAEDEFNLDDILAEFK